MYISYINNSGTCGNDADTWQGDNREELKDLKEQTERKVDKRRWNEIYFSAIFIMAAGKGV